METRRLTTPAAAGGIILILTGLLFLLISLGSFNLTWGNSWPLYMMVPGAVLLVAAFTTGSRSARGALVFPGSLLILLGAFFLATTLGYVSWGAQGKLWPIYLLVLGLAFLAAYAAAALKGTAYLLAGGLFTVLGVLLLVASLSGLLYSVQWPVLSDVFSGWGWMGTWWPMVLLLLGGGLLALALARGLDRDRQMLVGLGSFVLLLGVFFQLTTVGVLSWHDQGRFWPVYLVILGLALLAGRSAARPHRL